MVKHGSLCCDARAAKRCLRLKKPHVWIRNPEVRKFDGDDGDGSGSYRRSYIHPCHGGGYGGRHPLIKLAPIHLQQIRNQKK
jgi:hypothetical protein